MAEQTQTQKTQTPKKDEKKHQPRVSYPPFSLPTTTTGKLREEIKKLPTAGTTNVFVGSGKGEYVQALRHQAVLVKPSNYVAAVLTRRYNVVQHHEAFTRLLDAVNLISPDVKGQVVNNKARAYLFIGMPEKFTYKAPDGKEMTLGFSAVNSYDGTTGIHIGAFGFRLVCSNGMLLTKTLGSISVDHIHGVKQRLDGLFTKMELNLATLSERIDAAMEAKMQYQYAEAWAQNFAGKDNAIKIAELFKKDGDKTVWGLYNGLTNFLSHSTTNPTGRMLQLSRAERLLIEPKSIVQEAIELHKIRREAEEAKARAEG